MTCLVSMLEVWFVDEADRINTVFRLKRGRTSTRKKPKHPAMTGQDRTQLCEVT